MSAEPLCLCTFGEIIRPCMSKNMYKKEYILDGNLFETDIGVRDRAPINGSGVFVFYSLLLESILYLPAANAEKDIPDINKTMTTQIKRGKAEVHSKVKEIAQRKDAAVAVGMFFAANITSNIPKVLDPVVYKIDALVQGDTSLGKKMQMNLKKCKTNKTPADYLAEVLIVAVCFGKNVVDDKEPDKSSKADPSAEMSALIEAEKLLASFPEPTIIPPPKMIADFELKYIKALFQAYGDAEGILGFDENSLLSHPDYADDLDDRRIDYFAAESVRRGVSELRSDLYQGQFETLKLETHDGVKDTAKKKYPNGYERMLAVMEQATAISVNGYILSRSHNWISNKIKKGVCHFLVVGDKLKWVK